MIALSFLTSGGMANIGGDLPNDEQEAVKEAAKAFGELVRVLALQKRIPAAQLTVFNAQWFLCWKDQQSYHLMFAERPGAMTSVRFLNAQQYKALTLEQLEGDVRLNVGEPVFGFSVPVGEVKSGKFANEIANAAGDYIAGLIADISASSPNKIDPKLCFVIMSFSQNPQLKDFYDLGIKPTIEAFGYRCERVDEQEFNGSIRDRILANIAAAKFIVADVSEARPNCYYELGIAHSMGKEVVHLASDAADVHFDIKDFNFIVYQRIADLKTNLEQRIRATVGQAA